MLPLPAGDRRKEAHVAHWRLPMRHTLEILRLYYEVHLPGRAVARSVGVSPATVHKVIKRADKAGLVWPPDPPLTQIQVEELLFGPAEAIASPRSMPDWADVHRELKKKDVTLQLLWEDFREGHPDGLGRTQFFAHYRRFAAKLDLTLRQTHRAGEKTFIDYAGRTVPVINRKTGAIRYAQVFVAVLGASSYSYGEATWTQATPDWVASHVRACAFFGGVTAAWVPDNLKAGVIIASRYEPYLNATYQELARHYGCWILPARVRKPKDKAKAEVGVQVVQRWILARLRNHRFFSLDEVNDAIRPLLGVLNDRPFRKMPGSRRRLFEELDKPALLPLPSEPYDFAEWRTAKVHLDCHVQVDKNFYSAPSRLVHERLDVRLGTGTVELFFKGESVALYPRALGQGERVTKDEHLPPAHRQAVQMTAEGFIDRARAIGPHTAALVQAILENRPRPEFGYRTCQGIVRLGARYPKERVEAACERALAHRALSYRRVVTILEKKLDQLPMDKPPAAQSVLHENVRGSAYYEKAAADMASGGEPTC